MKIYKPNFWDKKRGLLAVLLFPISFIVLLYIFFKKKIIERKKYNIPIVCIGNIYLGGTGKTPLSILIANQLRNKNKNPVIVKKFYKKHSDEHILISKNFKNLIICKNRSEGISEAIEYKYDTVILDDGYQDYQINKNISILCFHQNQLIGNGLVIPAGPLRESLNAVKDTQIIIINGKKDLKFEEKLKKFNKNLIFFYSEFKPKNISDFKNKKLLAVAGIGNPKNFFNILRENNLNVAKELVFPDHYQYSKYEISEIIKFAKKNNYITIMTEKDYYRVQKFGFNEIKYLKVSLEISQIENLIKKILVIYDKNI